MTSVRMTHRDEKEVPEPNLCALCASARDFLSLVFRKAVYNSRNSILHSFQTEIQHETELQLHQNKIRAKLLWMHRMIFLSGFNFNNNRFLNQQINPKSFVKLDAVKFNLHRNLPAHSQSAPSKLASERPRRWPEPGRRLRPSSCPRCAGCSSPRSPRSATVASSRSPRFSSLAGLSRSSSATSSHFEATTPFRSGSGR